VAAIDTLQYLHLLPFGFDLWDALLCGLMTVIGVGVVVQLWSVNPQGWIFLVSALNLIVAVSSIIDSISLSDVLPSTVINSAVLIYCLTPGVQAHLGPGNCLRR
jgi:hypothetical protein